MDLTKKEFEKMLSKLAIKEDFKDFATKSDLKDFAKKGDLQSFATKEDLKPFATKDDLKPFATKKDLKEQTIELKAYGDEQTEKLARIIATTVAEPMERTFTAIAKAATGSYK